MRIKWRRKSYLCQLLEKSRIKKCDTYNFGKSFKRITLSQSQDEASKLPWGQWELQAKLQHGIFMVKDPPNLYTNIQIPPQRAYALVSKLSPLTNYFHMQTKCICIYLLLIFSGDLFCCIWTMRYKGCIHTSLDIALQQLDWHIHTGISTWEWQL